MPWNDTWIDLPTLPDWTYPDGTVYPVTDTLIMSLASPGGANILHLLGGANVDWTTRLETVNRKVWQLGFDRGSQSYFWTDKLDPDMCKCGFWCHVIIFLFDRYVYGKFGL